MKILAKHEFEVSELLTYLTKNVIPLCDEETEEQREEGIIRVGDYIIEDIKQLVNDILKGTKDTLKVGQQVMFTQFVEYMKTDSSGEAYPSDRICEVGTKGRVRFISEEDSYNPYIEIGTQKGWVRLRTDEPLPFVIIKDTKE